MLIFQIEYTDQAVLRVSVFSFHSYSNKHDNASKNVPLISMATGIQQQKQQHRRYANAQSTATT